MKPAADPQAVFDEMLERASRQGDIPSFSSSVKCILTSLAEAGDDEDDVRLVQTVLTDAALTQKVLKLANSAMYAMFDGEVTTVSHAVRLLGLQTVGHLALGLKVIESFDANCPRSAATRAEMEKAVLAGHLGRQLAANASTADAEAASVCSILQGLGRLLTSFYLPERWQLIQQRLGRGENERDAALAELGMPLDEVGSRMAEHWGLPASLSKAMGGETPAEGQRAQTHEQWLRMLATAANQSAQVLHDEGFVEDSTRLAGIVERFSLALGLEPGQMLSAAMTAHQAAIAQQAPRPEGVAAVPAIDKLCQGLKELREAVERGSSPTALMTQALETLHTSLSASRSALFVRVVKEHRYCARTVLGRDMQSRIAAMTFDDRFQPEVFHVALGAERVMYLQDARAMRSKFASWWVSALGDAASVCIVPLQVNARAVGCLYLDWTGASASRVLDEECLALVSQLRQLVVGHMTRALAVSRAVSAAA